MKFLDKEEKFIDEIRHRFVNGRFEFVNCKKPLPYRNRISGNGFPMDHYFIV
jgi:hypothetical protein